MLAAGGEEGGGGVQVDGGAAAEGAARRTHVPARHARQVLVAAPLHACQAARRPIQQRLHLQITTAVSRKNHVHLIVDISRLKAWQACLCTV